MRQLRNLIPLIASLGVFLFASNSPMWKQMNEPHSVENKVKFTPVTESK